MTPLHFSHTNHPFQNHSKERIPLCQAAPHTPNALALRALSAPPGLNLPSSYPRVPAELPPPGDPMLRAALLGISDIRSELVEERNC